MTLLTLNNISKIYDQRSIFGVKDISFSMNSAEILCLTGPSGSGKSTLLNIIMGELTPDSGSFTGTNHKSYIPQFYELDEQKTVLENIISSISHETDLEKKTNLARSCAQSLEITNEVKKKISQISGGQKQRVIIACALASEPELLVMDEPFSHLDPALRKSLISDMWDIFRDKKIALLWVTHDKQEALAYSDRVILLNNGKIEQISTPKEIYLKPKTMFCAKFFSEANCIAGKIIDQESKTIDFLGNQFSYKGELQTNEHQDALVMIRPESISISDDGELKGKVIKQLFCGGHNLVDIEYKDKQLTCKSYQEIEYTKGQKIYFNFNYDQFYCLSEI